MINSLGGLHSEKKEFNDLLEIYFIAAPLARVGWLTSHGSLTIINSGCNKYYNMLHVQTHGDIANVCFCTSFNLCQITTVISEQRNSHKSRKEYFFE